MSFCKLIPKLLWFRSAFIIRGGRHYTQTVTACLQLRVFSFILCSWDVPLCCDVSSDRSAFVFSITHAVTGDIMHTDMASRPRAAGSAVAVLLHGVSSRASRSKRPERIRSFRTNPKFFTTVWFRIPFFWGTGPHSWLIASRRFGGTLCLHFQGSRGPTSGPSDATSYPHISYAQQHKLGVCCTGVTA